MASSGKVAWSHDPGLDPLYHGEDGIGTLAGVPLAARGRVVGVMTMAFRGQRTISHREAGQLEAMGTGVGVAVENARLYRHARRVAVLEERERIGMDLHDGIIQSIYAVGLTLDYTRLLMRESAEKAGVPAGAGHRRPERHHPRHPLLHPRPAAQPHLHRQSGRSA